jgi:hypothetical protein
MSFCEHCEGQRFDRAQVLRLLRTTHRKLRHESRAAEEALRQAIRAVRSLEIPHLEREDEISEDEVIH